MAYTVPHSEKVVDAIVGKLRTLSEANGDSFAVDPASVGVFDLRAGQGVLGRPPAIRVGLPDSTRARDRAAAEFQHDLIVTIDVTLRDDPDDPTPMGVRLNRAREDVQRNIAAIQWDEASEVPGGAVASLDGFASGEGDPDALNIPHVRIEAQFSWIDDDRLAVSKLETG